MFRIDTPNKAVDLFGAGKHGFRDGDKALGINPTELSASQQNALQEELAAIVEAAGLALNKANNGQVLEALQRLIDAQSGNYALDTGAANAYVVALSPAITAYGDGMTVRFKIANTNTGASTLNAGAGAVAWVNDVGGVLAGGDLPAGGIATATYIASANKFYSTALVQSQADARYSKLDQSSIAQDFRLSLTTGVPVTTSDVVAATTLYCTPYKGNRIGLYNGSAWVNYTSAEFSLALGTLTSGKPYDVFCYQNSGVPTLEFLVWTNDTTRATALAYNNGILIKSGDATRRYLGTFYTTATTTTEDSLAKRYLWNYYNRVRREMYVAEATASWNYTTATWRQANASAANQLNFIVGVPEDIVTANVTGSVANSAGSGVAVGVAIGLDNTTTPLKNYNVNGTFIAVVRQPVLANVSILPGAGRHYLAWLEYSQAGTGTTTWTGNSSLSQNGISGELLS